MYTEIYMNLNYLSLKDKPITLFDSYKLTRDLGNNNNYIPAITSGKNTSL